MNREKIGKIINKIGGNLNFHIVSIDTASAPPNPNLIGRSHYLHVTMV